MQLRRLDESHIGQVVSDVPGRLRDRVTDLVQRADGAPARRMSAMCQPSSLGSGHAPGAVSHAGTACASRPLTAPPADRVWREGRRRRRQG